MMGPGPSTVPERVLTAMARPTIGHLDPHFIILMDEIKSLLRYAFQTENHLTFPVSAPGSAGMEMCFVNLVEPGDKVIVCENGVFGGRMRENVERAGGHAILVKDEWGHPVSPDKLAQTLAKNPDVKAVAFVHAETSTGALSDAKILCALARKYKALTIVDTVTSLGGVRLKVDEWDIDATYSGSQKCLSCSPGLSPVSFSDRAIKAVKARTTKVQSWFLDLSLVMAYWEGAGGRSYHHTAPVNAMYGLHEALLMLKEEGLEAAWARHASQHMRLRDGLEAIGFTYLVEPDFRLPQLNSVILPKTIKDEAHLRSILLSKHNIEIGGGLGALTGKIWRIGLMGHTAQEPFVDRFLDTLKTVMDA